MIEDLKGEDEDEYDLIYNKDFNTKRIKLEEDSNDPDTTTKVTLDLGDGKVFHFTPENDIKDEKKELKLKNQCFHCHKHFVTQKVLKMHMDSQHFGMRYKCQDCEKDYDNQANLNRHINAKHKGIGYQCESCDFVSNDYSNMKRHRLQMHTDTYAFDCPRCDFKCKEKGNLGRHIERIHLRHGPKKKPGRRKTLPLDDSDD